MMIINLLGMKIILNRFNRLVIGSQCKINIFFSELFDKIMN